MATPYMESAAEVLAFEERWPSPHRSAKAAAIRTRFGLNAARYYSILNRLLDSDEVAAAYPEAVGRLRARRARRTARRRGGMGS